MLIANINVTTYLVVLETRGLSGLVEATALGLEGVELAGFSAEEKNKNEMKRWRNVYFTVNQYDAL